ncbi:MAG TPA: hypothetical protein VGR35_16080 [Tepidisphaeraceae bacterium]|nr:hypothetical protein [Tepidisphaeraceae bacterium]
MISITCTNCQTSLSIDDAFAGGVCRCQHCGTIQTVPSKKKPGPGGTAAGLGVKSPKTLYQKRVRDASVGTGLDELAEVVTSSGLTSSGLSSRSARPTRAVAPAPKSNMTWILGIVAIAVIVLLVVILVLVMQRTPGSGTTADQSPVSAGANAGAAGQPAGAPMFCGIPLEHESVVYLLDRGSSTQSPFGSLKEATLESIASLGPRRRFQIIFWDNGQDPGAFPALLTFASEANLMTIRRQIDEVFAFGATDPGPAFAKAIAQRPAAIVIATGKAADLDDSFVQMIKDTKKNVQVVIHTIGIGGSGQSTALKTVADMTGGQYRELSEAELSKYAR